VGGEGATLLEAAEGGPVPTLFVAVTVNVYVLPFVRFGTVAVVAGGVPLTVVGVCGVLPIQGVTVYDEIVLPFAAGAFHDTVACPFPATAVTPVGAFGTLAGADSKRTVPATDGTSFPLTRNSM